MDHTERRTDDTLRGQRRELAACFHTRAALIDSPLQNPEHLYATLKHAGARTQRLHEHEPAQSGLTVEETEQRAEARTNRCGPIALTLVCGYDDRHQLLDRMVKRREETIFAVREQVIERLIRNPRAARDAARCHPPVPILRDDSERRVEQPRALQLGHIHAATPGTRRTRTAHPYTPRRGHQQPPPIGERRGLA